MKTPLQVKKGLIMKLSSATTLALLTSSIFLASCNSNSGSENAQKETIGVSAQEQKKEEEPKPDTPVVDDSIPVDTEVTASEICQAAFSLETSSYFETSDDQQGFKDFLRKVKLVPEVETCKSFDDVSFSISPAYVNLYKIKNVGKWINEFFPFMYNVTSLVITDESVGDISNIRFLTQLDFLMLDNSSISDLSPLKRLNGFILISLEKTQITNESLRDLPLGRNMIEGYTLKIGRNPQITNIEGLVDAKAFIRGLSLRENNNISDFSPLAKLGRLSNLDLSGTVISENDLDQYVTSKLQFMRELNLAETDISNIEGLKKLEKLEKLNLTNARVKNLNALMKLENLKDLYLSKEQLKTLDLSKLPKHIKPSVLKETL